MGLAFARGALFNLRSIVSQPDCDRFHETLKRMAHDITERHRAERELRKSEERFRVALKNSPTVVFPAPDGADTSRINGVLRLIRGSGPVP
mgnify:CR=1 FL=1